jgi:polysaccharide deacetylase family sporulation protein PdaB
VKIELNPFGCHKLNILKGGEMLPRVFGFYEINPQTRLILVAALVLLLLATGTIYVQACYRQRPLHELRTDRKIVALTFEISWGGETPPAVLDILKAHNVQCTFFLSGPWVSENPEMTQRIQADGHEIASHGHRHINLCNLSKSEIKTEIMKAHQAIGAVTGEKPHLIRTPNGDCNDTVLAAIRECDYEAVQWGTDTLDWMNPGTGRIIERINKHIRPGEIIFMHASDTCKQTAAALPTILHNIHNQGYQVVTVSELLQEARR